MLGFCPYICPYFFRISSKQKSSVFWQPKPLAGLWYKRPTSRLLGIKGLGLYKIFYTTLVLAGPTGAAMALLLASLGPAPSSSPSARLGIQKHDMAGPGKNAFLHDPHYNPIQRIIQSLKSEKIRLILKRILWKGWFGGSGLIPRVVELENQLQSHLL